MNTMQEIEEAITEAFLYFCLCKNPRDSLSEVESVALLISYCKKK